MGPLIEEKVNGEITRTGKMTRKRAAKWAKPNCRRCHGRGLEPYDHPGLGTETLFACSCVIKNLQRS